MEMHHELVQASFRGQSPPLREHLYYIATERAELYRSRPPEGLCVPILSTLVEVKIGVPEKE